LNAEICMSASSSEFLKTMVRLHEPRLIIQSKTTMLLWPLASAWPRQP
jgi:hypothetical protein